MSRASSALADTRAVAEREERPADERQDVELRIVGRARRRAGRHLHAAAARRDEADADLDAADVQLGRGAHALAAQHHLGAAAQRQAERRRHDRDARVARAQEGVLEVDDHLVDDLACSPGRAPSAGRTGSRPRRTRRRRRCRSPARRRRARRCRPPSSSWRRCRDRSRSSSSGTRGRRRRRRGRGSRRCALRSTSPPAARIASSDSARGSVGIGVKPPRCAELAQLARRLRVR